MSLQVYKKMYRDFNLLILPSDARSLGLANETTLFKKKKKTRYFPNGLPFAI